MPETGEDMFRKILKSLNLTKNQEAILLEVRKKDLIKRETQKSDKIIADITEKQKGLLEGLRALNIARSERLEDFIEDFIDKSLKTELDFEEKFKLSTIMILKLIYNRLKDK